MAIDNSGGTVCAHRVSIFTALLLIGFTGCTGETARWEFSQAQRLAERGEVEAAIEQMRHAVQKSGESWELALPFAFELSKRGDRESIAICDRVLAREEIQRDENLLYHARNTKVECLLNLGDFSDALVTLKTLFRDRVSRTELDENRLAYIRALANAELELAYVNVNQAIQAIASDWCCGERLDILSKTVVASALLARFFLDETRENPQIEPLQIAETRLLESKKFLSQLIEIYESRYGSFIECVESREKNAINLERCTARNNLVVLLIVRALVAQDLNEIEQCNRDRYQAARMRKDLEKIVEGLPNERSCLHLLNYAAAFLDTRGFIQSRLPWPENPESATESTSSYAESLDNLNVAILASQMERRALKGKLVNHVNFSVTNIRSMQARVDRSEAVLRYHRMLTHQRARNTAAAELDRLAIVELGFTPGEHLF
jgi:tetratricopeptide (TPR) repeat protein